MLHFFFWGGGRREHIHLEHILFLKHYLHIGFLLLPSSVFFLSPSGEMLPPSDAALEHFKEFTILFAQFKVHHCLRTKRHAEALQLK